MLRKNQNRKESIVKCCIFIGSLPLTKDFVNGFFYILLFAYKDVNIMIEIQLFCTVL